MVARLEYLLVNLAKTHAPTLVPADWEKSGTPLQRLPNLARALAGYHVLVIVGEVPDTQATAKAALIEGWVAAYGDLYGLLSTTLFPSYTGLNARYGDDQEPVVIVIDAEARPVAQIMAGLIIPYLSSRQSTPGVSEAELRGLMDIVLDELEAGDLPRAESNRLRDEGVATLKRLLASPVQHIALTAFDRPLFGADTLPERTRRLLSGTESPAEQSPPDVLLMTPVPLPSRSPGEKPTRPPPIPRLPDDNE